MKLIDNARDWWRMLSVQVMAFWSAALVAWPLLSETQRADLLAFFGIPPTWINGVLALFMFVTFVLARVKKQGPLHAKDPE
jgi:hypothetical protein